MTEPDHTRQPEVAHSPPGRVKIELCQRLGDDWRLLADYFEIPDDQRRRFEKGWECQGVWTWLEARGRLGELPEGLRYIKRADLAELWVERQKEELEHYYQDCIARWSDPRYALDKRFVNLTLLLDQGEQAQGAALAGGQRAVSGPPRGAGAGAGPGAGAAGGAGLWEEHLASAF